MRRIEFGISSVLSNQSGGRKLRGTRSPCPVYFPVGHIGVDRSNNYLMLFRFGLMDPKGHLLSEKQRVGLTDLCEKMEKVGHQG